MFRLLMGILGILFICWLLGLDFGSFLSFVKTQVQAIIDFIREIVNSILSSIKP